MYSRSFFFSDTDVELRPAPVRPEWVVAGTPVSRHAEISQGRMRNSTAFIWDCTAGTFNWFYDTDEIVHVLEGSVLLSQNGGPVRRVQAGDVVFFPAGSSARWEVETYIRKFAVFSRKVPKPIQFALDVMRGVKRLLRPQSVAYPVPAMMG